MASQQQRVPSRITVVIPVRDDAAVLARCLRALAEQDLRADEVIVVDNGSSDSSAAVAVAAGARVVRCDERGIPAASAAGYDAASGGLILRLDADCVPASSWTRDVVARLQGDPGLVAVTGRGRFADGPRGVRAVLGLLYLGAYAIATIPALGHLPLFGSNMAFRADAWRRVRETVHRHDAEVHDDLDLAFHLGREGAIGRLRATPMGISFRPMRSASGFRRRLRRGLHTVVVHWPDDLPPRRWARGAGRRG